MPSSCPLVDDPPHQPGRHDDDGDDDGGDGDRMLMMVLKIIHLLTTLTNKPGIVDCFVYDKHDADVE